MVRWNSSKEGKLLCSLFEQGVADPAKQKPAEIDPIKELREEFKPFTAQTFRSNFRTTANNWINAQSLSGVRRNALNTSIRNDDEEEEFIVEEVEEETMMMSPAPTTAAPPAPPKKAIGNKGFKPNETQFHPRFTSHVYPAKNYWREQIIIETPSSFNGYMGTYEAGIDVENNQFVFKIPPNDLFNDPHTIHAYQAAKYGRKFGDDSAKAQAFKDSTKSRRKNWSTFRHNIKFKATQSDDLGAVPWIDFAVIEYDGRKIGILIVELKSIEPIEKEEVIPEMDKTLKMNTFTSPAKMKGVDFANGSTAQEALFLQEMIKRGLKMSDLQNIAKRNGMTDTDDMNLEGDIEAEEQGSSQRRRTGGTEATFGNTNESGFIHGAEFNLN